VLEALATQIAICAVLVTASLVGVRGLARSLESKLSVDPHHAMLVETDPSQASYTGDAIPAVQKRMIEALQAIPGVNVGGTGGPVSSLAPGLVRLEGLHRPGVRPEAIERRSGRHHVQRVS